MTDANQQDVSESQASEAFSTKANQRCEITEAAEEERRNLAHRENKAVAWLRIAVVVVLLTTTVLVSAAVFMYTKHNQINDFETQFEAYATKVIESFHDSVERKIEAVDALTTSITSSVLTMGATWPNVSIPDFAIRSCNSRILADTVYFNFAPLVTDENRAGWEAYAREHRDAVFNATLAADFAQRKWQDERFGIERHLQAQAPFPDRIVSMIANGSSYYAPEGSGPYLPQWHISPFVPLKQVFGFNLLSHPSGKGAYAAAIKSKKAVISFADNRKKSGLGDTGKFFEAILSVGQYRNKIQEFLGDPMSVMAYPVFDSFGPDRKLVGLLNTNVYWSLLFKDILPDSAKGIICVLQNTFNQTFSYRIDGPTMQYLGGEDYHDSAYDHLKVSADVAAYIKARTSIETRSYTSVDLDTEFSSYSIHVYPSKATKDEFVNNSPLIFTIIIVCVFAFTSLVFIVYDAIVARRQKIVMERAIASGLIVSSLFPTQVRDQIYQEKQELTRSSMNAKTSSKAHSKIVENTLNDQMETAPEKSRPIAQLFPATTIMFADLAGFTKWSSSRTPVEVFELLESIYSAFDYIAKRRKVFKIETIGDCYVAVAGLPNPQEDHAVIMAKFAHHCMNRMNELVRELVETLGSDTADLQMRVGLHSGAVTGGVLRGDKGRFQLFGDTMNTASRMESNGIGGRIHVSQDTANELTAHGYANWLTPREEKIVAKGKGEMQTYWVVVSTAKSITTASSSFNPSRSFQTDPTSGDCGEVNSAALSDDDLRGRVMSRLGAASMASTATQSTASDISNQNCQNDRIDI